MDVVVAGIAVAAFAATVFVLARAGGRLSRAPARRVAEPAGEEWMTTVQVAEMLDVAEADVLTLVERDAIPYYVAVRRRPRSVRASIASAAARSRPGRSADRRAGYRPAPP